MIAKYIFALHNVDYKALKYYKPYETMCIKSTMHIW